MDAFLAKALDSLEKRVVEPLNAKASEIVEEFPKEGIPTATSTRSQDALDLVYDTRLRWEEFDLERKLSEWKKKLHDVREPGKGSVPGMQNEVRDEDEFDADKSFDKERADQLEQAMEAMIDGLRGLPDPSNVLFKLQKAITELREGEQERHKLFEELEVARRDARSARGFKQQAESLRAEIDAFRLEMEERKDQFHLESNRQAEEEKRALQTALEEERGRREVAEEKMKQFVTAHGRSQELLLQSTSKIEELSQQRQSELDDLVEELERAKQRAVELERELEQQKVFAANQDRTFQTSTTQSAPEWTAHEEPVMASKDHEILENRLIDTEARLAELQNEHERICNEYTHIQGLLDERPTQEEYEKMKAQVAVFLHYLESRDIDLDPNRTLEIGHMEMIDDIKLSLEARNKQMGLELAQTKEKLSEHEDIRAQHETMISDLKDDLERQSKTLEKLEGDLVTASRTLPGQDDADKFLEIIVSQRDRMKERCDQLAMEVDLARMKLEDADSTRQKLEEENLALFEKAKYMEHWAVSRDSTQMGQPNPHRLNPPGNRAPKLGRLGCGPAEVPLVVEGHLSHANGPRRRFGCFGPEQETAAEAGTLGTVEEKYSRAYAEKLNPFQQFTDLERQKQVRRLGLGDRVAFMMGKMIGSHAGRIFLVVYIMLLHFFVFALVMTTII